MKMCWEAALPWQSDHKRAEAFRKEYAKPRKTLVENAAEAVYEEKKIEEMPVVVLMDRFGYVKTVDEAVYERNKGGGGQ